MQKHTIPNTSDETTFDATAGTDDLDDDPEATGDEGGVEGIHLLVFIIYSIIYEN